MAVRVFGIGWSAPVPDADEDGAVGGEVGDGVNGVGEEGVRPGQVTGGAFQDGEEEVDDTPTQVTRDMSRTAVPEARS